MKVAKAEKGKCALTGNPASKTSELVVGLCCGNCKGKFDKNPKDFIAKVEIPKKKD